MKKCGRCGYGFTSGFRVSIHNYLKHATAFIWGKAVMNYAYILLEFSAKYLVSKRREEKEEKELIEE